MTHCDTALRYKKEKFTTMELFVFWGTISRWFNWVNQFGIKPLPPSPALGVGNPDNSERYPGNERAYPPPPFPSLVRLSNSERYTGNEGAAVNTRF